MGSLRKHNSFAEANCKRSWLRACKDIVVGPIHSDSVGCSVGLPSFLDECVPQNTQFFRRSKFLSAPLRACKDIVVGPIHSDYVGCSVGLPSFLDECVPQNTQFFRRSKFLSAPLRACKD